MCVSAGKQQKCQPSQKVSSLMLGLSFFYCFMKSLNINDFFQYVSLRTEDVSLVCLSLYKVLLVFIRFDPGNLIKYCETCTYFVGCPHL